jgi:hypothetical protein
MLLHYMASYSKIVILVDFILVNRVAPPHFYFMSGQDSDESRVILSVFCRRFTPVNWHSPAQNSWQGTQRCAVLWCYPHDTEGCTQEDNIKIHLREISGRNVFRTRVHVILCSDDSECGNYGCLGRDAVQSCTYFSSFAVILKYCCHVSGVPWLIITSPGFGFIDILCIHTTRDYRQYSAIAELRTLQFTVAHALGFSVFISRILATDLSQFHYHFRLLVTV